MNRSRYTPALPNAACASVRLLQGRFQGQVIGRDAHSLPAAPRRRLDQHRKANRVGRLQCLVIVTDQPRAARNDGHLGFFRHSPRGVLIAERFHGLWRRPNKVDVAAAADFVEVGVLRKKAIPRMNGFDIPHFGGADDLVDLQVALRCAGAQCRSLRRPAAGIGCQHPPC